MDLGSLRALALDVNFSAHGVPAIVTLSREDPITTRGIWLQPTTEDVPVGDFTRREPRRVMALRRDEVPSVPRGTLIVAPEISGGPDKAWRADGMDRVDADHHRVIVQFDEAATLDLPDPS